MPTAHFGKVGRNTVKCTTAFLYSDWQYFQWYGQIRLQVFQPYQQAILTCLNYKKKKKKHGCESKVRCTYFLVKSVKVSMRFILAICNNCPFTLTKNCPIGYSPSLFELTSLDNLQFIYQEIERQFNKCVLVSSNHTPPIQNWVVASELEVQRNFGFTSK